MSSKADMLSILTNFYACSADLFSDVQPHLGQSFSKFIFTAADGSGFTPCMRWGTELSGSKPSSDWLKDVGNFLVGNLPVSLEGEGWDHMFLSSYQISCMALVALGRAEETQWGAIPRPSPPVTMVLPRCDDVCVVVLRLAEQQDMLGYRLRDGNVPPPGKGAFVARELDAPPPPGPNIAAAHGLGPARAAPEVAAMLETLNLVSQGRWTEAAETVL